MTHITPRIATCLACIGMMAPLNLVAGTVSTSPALPPSGGAYVANVDACYLLGQTLACLQQGSDGDFVNPSSVFQNGNQLATFGSTLNAMLTVNGIPQGPVQFQGQASVLISGRTSQSQLGTFDTEMLAFDMTGNLPGVMIRESPTLASLGTTSVQDIAAARALFQIDSFFDIFTELSTDGGQTWIPSNGATRVDLQSAAPEPGTWFLLSTSLAGLAAFRLRRRG